MSSSSNNPGSRLTFAHVAIVIIAILAIGLGISRLPVQQSESQPFASPAFQSTWTNEASAATRAVDLWGGEPLSSRVEPFIGAPNDRRMVQYFERGRMEVESGASSVTQGKLVLELVTGEIDLGGNITIERPPPAIPIDSGDPDERVPTWQTLARIVSNAEPRGDDAEGERIVTWLDRSGPFDAGTNPEWRRLEQYVEETGFYLPDVTAELFDRPEFDNERWVESFGYPISDPYWTHYRRMDQTYSALIQVFERRVLIYTPEIEDSRTFTVPSIGRHYSLWRYGSEPTMETAELPEEWVPANITLGEHLEASVYAENIGTPVDLGLTPSGHLMILTAEGDILQADSLDPDGMPEGFELWASGIDDPQGITTVGDRVVVTAAEGIEFYVDRDGTGVRTDAESSLMELGDSSQVHSVRGKPVRSSSGDVFSRIETADGEHVLREIGTSNDIVPLHEHVDEAGPIEFAGSDLLFSGRHQDDRTGVLLLPSITSEAISTEPQPVGSFPEYITVRALAAVNEEMWSISELGEFFVAVQDDEDARIYALTRTQRIDEEDEIEAIEIASGLSRPTALQIGLDGSLYVADAETGRIIRIRYTG